MSKNLTNDKTDSSNFLYIKLNGESVNLGRADIGAAGKTLLALDKWTRAYKKANPQKDTDIQLKLGNIREGSTELQVFLDVVNTVMNSPAAQFGGTAILLGNTPGVKDFLKKFGGTLGEQLALKIFAKGKKLTESDLFVKDRTVRVYAVNEFGDRREVDKKQLDLYRNTSNALNGLNVVNPGKIDSVSVGYHTASEGYSEVGKIDEGSKDAFIDLSDPDEYARRMNEPFNEEKAKEEKIIGQFVDFHGLAYRYKFSFQARKDQDNFGKQKILCIVDEKQVSDILELLKPENKKNICISGKAIRDMENRVDKIKIDWFNENPDFNPDQTELLQP